jgi:hypothetical protein
MKRVEHMKTQFKIGDYIFIKDKWLSNNVYQIKTIDNKTLENQQIIGIETEHSLRHHFIGNIVRVATITEIKKFKIKEMFIK